MAESGFPDLFDDFVSSLRTAERVATSVRTKATSLESELAAALKREKKLKQDLGKLEVEYKSAQKILRTKEAELEVREKKLRAAEDEVRKDRAEWAEDLSSPIKPMQKTFERHTVKRSTKSEPPENRCSLGAPDDGEPASKRMRLQEPTSTPVKPVTLQTNSKKPTSRHDVLTFAQKKDLSEAIAQLSGGNLEKVIKIIHEGVPDIKDRNRTAKGTGTGGLKRKRMTEEQVLGKKIRMLERRMALFEQGGSAAAQDYVVASSSSGSDSSGSDSE
ncbi:hypothetical protein C8R43DRAFT_1208994 [Mycena crocata]|nr:hypothetical protein C8R43DRAFT_1208994 [Mycena crocata]